MANSPKIHFYNVRRIGDRTITGTLCSRMVGDDYINSSQFRTDVTCRLCQRALAAQENGAARAAFQAEVTR